MKKLLALLAILPGLVGAYCEPQLPANAASVTLGATGTETITKAYGALPSAGGVILVPYGTYGCEQAFWAASQSSVMKSFTLKGIPDASGNRPKFECGTGTLMSFGLPYSNTTTAEPNPTPNITVMFDGIEVNGWGQWVVGANFRRLVLNNSKFSGIYGGAIVTGQGITKGEMEHITQDSNTEVCGSEFSHAGNYGLYHPLYIHGGPWINKGVFAFINSSCHDARNSICVKTTVTGKVVIKNSTITNTCTDPLLAPNNCGTNLIDTTGAAKLTWIEGNTLTRGNAANPGQELGTAQLVTVQDRLYSFGGLSSGGAFSPLYDRPWGSPEWNDASFWNAAKAGVDDETNSYLRLSVFIDNTVTNYANSKSAILGNGTAPFYRETAYSSCMTPLSVPTDWVELSRIVVINNNFTGNFALATPWEVRGVPYCSGATDYTNGALMGVWNLGGNSINNTVAKVTVPAWLRSRGGVIATPVADTYSGTSTLVAGGRTHQPLWRRNVAANTWAQVGANKLSDIDPMNDPSINPNYPSAPPWNAQMGFLAAFTQNWDGAAWDETNGTYWLPMGGGHNGYAGNETYKINLTLDSPSWSMKGRPSGAVGNAINLNDGYTNIPTWVNDGRVRPGHSYDHLVWLPNRGAVWTIQSAVSFAGGGTCNTWFMDQATGEWANKSPALTNCLTGTYPVTGQAYTNVVGLPSPYDMGAAYDSSRDVIWLRNNRNAKLWSLDPATWTWNKSASIDTPPAVNVSKLIYLPEKDVLVEFSGTMTANVQSTPTMSIWHLQYGGTRTVSTLSGTPTTGLVLGSDYMGVAFDGSKLLVWNNSTNTAQISTLTPNADLTVWTWGTLPLAAGNTVTPTARFVNGTFNRFVYSKRFKGLFLQQEPNQKLYFYATE